MKGKTKVNAKKKGGWKKNEKFQLAQEVRRTHSCNVTSLRLYIDTRHIVVHTLAPILYSIFM